ncbi:DUF4365 domain-containing protein [Mucilaginibacter sp. HD30]
MNRKPQLPRSSRQETLETISRNKLALRFNPELFELRPEHQRDKGVDVIGEIKQDGVYTNFRFAVQLKSTESVKKQKGGSLSYPVEISNIHYLLNFGLPSFYIMYDYPADLFYIASAAEVFRDLQKKYLPDQLPKSYKIKFTELLDEEKINGIYKETFDNGTLLKKLSAHMRARPENGLSASGFVIDELKDVYSVEQNIEYIDQAGFYLLNQHAFSQIVEIEQRTHPRVKASPTFNMVCGVAYYLQANLFKALDLLKLAHNEIESLHPEDRSMLSYTLAHAKYLLGLMGESEFRKATAEIAANENAGTFLQLENLYNKFLDSKDDDQRDRIKKFYGAAMQIVADHPDFHDMRVVAHAKVLTLEAKLLLHELAKNSILTMGRRVDAFRDLLVADWLRLDEHFLRQWEELYGYALKHRNFLSLSNLIMEKIEWEFGKVYHFHAFSNWDKDKLSIGVKVAPEDRVLLYKLLINLDKVIETYDRLLHRENHFNCLRCKYEILDFLGETEQANECAKLMKDLISTYEMNALRKRYDKMLRGDVKHRKLFADLAQRRAAIDHVARNSGIYEHLYGDITIEMNEILNRKPEWSLHELLPLTYPNESSEMDKDH